MTVSEKVKKRDMPEVLFRHISYLCFSAQLIYICILHAEAQRLGMAAAEDVYVAVSGSAVFYRVNLAVDHQFRSEWYTALAIVLPAVGVVPLAVDPPDHCPVQMEQEQ